METTETTIKDAMDKMPKITTVERKKDAQQQKDVPPVINEFHLEPKPKVAIVGCSDTNKKTPFDQKDDFEFWGVNNLYTTLKNKPFTRWFEIHNIEKNPVTGFWTRRGTNDFRGMAVDKYLRDLQELNIPVYMRSACELVSHAVLYPIQEILKTFGDYFTNTVSYMIALALLEGHYKEIHVYGVDMAVDTEYFWQRPSCEFFLGLAMGRGITVVLPDECDLLKTRFLYGFDDHMENKWIKKVDSMIESMNVRLSAAAQKKKVSTQQCEQYVGAIQAAHEMKKVWKNI